MVLVTLMCGQTFDTEVAKCDTGVLRQLFVLTATATF
jgi:hypothetical protein